MKQQFGVTHQYTVYRRQKKNSPILNRPTVKRIMFLRKYKEKQFFCGHNFLTEGVFVTQLYSNAGISV
jgi:hypothetical protein